MQASTCTIYLSIYTVLYTKNDADLLLHLFLDGMKKLKLAYLPLVFLYNLSQSYFEILPLDGATVGANRRLDGARSSALCYEKDTVCSGRGHEFGVVGEVHVMIVAQLDCAKYTRQREEGLFSNIKKKKSAAIFF